MKLCWVSVVALLGWTPSSPAQVIFDTPLSPRIANYAMTAELIPSERAVTGSYVLRWWNASTDTVRQLQFHLYLNAFRNNQSTFMKEGGSHRGLEETLRPGDWGYCDVRSLKVVGGADLTSRIEYIQPDDGNPDDRTVFRVRLDRPVAPQETINLTCEFYSKLPLLMARTGFSDSNFFMVAQWFPKIGVFKNGGWNCHQFHGDTEFFADFGVYDMTLTVPSEYVVGANAVLTAKKAGDSTTTYYYHQEDIHDAVWTAYPRFTVAHQTVTVARTGHTIEVTYLFAPGREVNRSEYFDCMQAAFDYFDAWVGEYPYPNLTVVDVPEGTVMSAGGMEYPTLITTGIFGPARGIPGIGGAHWLELVVFHELAHNYYYGMLASNEFEEPWLDEGFASLMEHRSLERFFRDRNEPEYAWVGHLEIASLDYHRSSYVRRARDGVITDKGWTIHPSSYQMAFYSKPVLVLTTLQRMLGEETMVRILHAYYDRWKFRHPTTPDFLAVVREVSGRDLSWFFDQFLFSNKVVDYQVVRIRNERISAPEGWLQEGGAPALVTKDSQRTASEDSSSAIWKATIDVRNNGDAYFPIPILICLANGDSVHESWNGRGGLKRFSLETRSPVTSVFVDPEQGNVLDLDLSNNVRYAEPDDTGIRRYTLRFLFWMQNLLQYLFTLV